jgi:MIP family channel proteins
MDDKNLRASMAEMIGTFALVLISAASTFIATLGGWQLGGQWWQAGLLWVALASGLMYAAMLAATLPVSGGYLNPAITIMLWVFRRLDGVRAFFFVVAQVVGAVVAGGILYLLLPSQEAVRMASHLGAPHLNLDYLGSAGSGLFASLVKGIGIELILTFLLVFTVFATMLDPRAPRWSRNWANRLACLWIGLTLVACTIAGFPLTGAALNPARWLGPAFWDWLQHPGALKDHAPYWIGPIAGSLLAGWIYTALILPAEEERRASVAAAPSTTRPAAASSALSRAKK